jgi:hypothetical protein
MQKFIAKFEPLIQAVLSGPDRLVFRGSLRSIQYAFGPEHSGCLGAARRERSAEEPGKPRCGVWKVRTSC